MSSPAPTDSGQVVEYDPTFLNARREAIVIFLAWAAGLVWCVPYCYFNGYGLDHDNISTIWGIPTWLFWGIAFPWCLANVFTIWFCACYMKIDNLSLADEENEAPADSQDTTSTNSEAAAGQEDVS